MTRPLRYLTILMIPLLTVACGSDDEESPSEQAASKLQDCGLATEGRIEALDSQCAADCITEASCEELEAVVCEEDFLQEVALCLFQCEPPAEDQFSCDNGDQVPSDWQCDGEDDCGDGSDEDGCDSSSQFTCDDGETVPASYECDGEPDCDDASDEDGCAQLICE